MLWCLVTLVPWYLACLSTEIYFQSLDFIFVTHTLTHRVTGQILEMHSIVTLSNSSLTSTFQDIIYHSLACVFHSTVTSYDSHQYWFHWHWSQKLLHVEPVGAFSICLNIWNYIHIHHMGIVFGFYLFRTILSKLRCLVVYELFSFASAMFFSSYVSFLKSNTTKKFLPQRWYSKLVC